MSNQRSSRGARTPSLALASVVLVSTLAALAPPASASTVWSVCADGSCGGFSIIADAVGAAAPGDTIFVYPGEYPEGPLFITKSLVICSIDPAFPYSCDPQTDATIIRGWGDDQVTVEIAADGVALQGFTITNPDYDDSGPWNAPTLVRVLGDNVDLSDLVLEAPARAPLPNQQRWRLVGISVEADSDAVTIARATIRGFPRVMGAAASCASFTPPCGAFGILNSGQGSTFRVEDSTIDLSGTGLRATGIAFDQNGVVHVFDNDITMPGSATGGAPAVIGIDGGVSHSAQIGGNTIAVAAGETPYGLYGIYGIFTASEILGNTIRDAQHGVMLRSSVAGDNRVAGNLFANGDQGLLNYAYGTEVENNRFTSLARAVVLDAVPGVAGASEDVVLFGNEFEQTGRALLLTDTVTGVFVDATHNDWGVYTRDLIETVAIDDASGTNVVDVSCFVDSDGITIVCPVAAIATQTLNAVWPRVLELSDVSIEGGREIEGRAWTFSNGPSSTEDVVARAFAPGTHTVTLTVTDSEGFSDTETLVLALTNAAPTLTAPAAIVAVEGASITVPLVASDADGDTLAYAMTGAPGDARLDPATGVLTWSPGYAADGAVWNVVFSVTDGSETTTAAATFEATDVPIAPVLAAPLSRSVLETRTLTFGVSAYDPDGGTVALSASGLPAGATFADHGAGTATFTWTPAAGTAGAYVVDITAATSGGITNTRSVVVNVAQSAGLTLTRVGASEVLVSPGEVVQLVATLANTGSGPDVFGASATRTSVAWSLQAPAPTSLAAGASAPVMTTVIAPAGGGSVLVTVKLCSDVDPALCKTVSWTLRTPLVVSLDMAPSFAALDAIVGAVTVTWLNGAPVEGAVVTLQEQPGLAGALASRETVSTAADGSAPYEFVAPTSSLPGAHLVFATARLGTSSGLAEDRYDVQV